MELLYRTINPVPNLILKMVITQKIQNKIPIIVGFKNKKGMLINKYNILPYSRIQTIT